MLSSLKQQLMLPQLALGGLETAFNALLKRSPHTLPTLRKLAGKVLQLELHQPNFTLFLIFSEQRTDWLGNFEGEADCRLSLNASTLPKLADKAQLAELINTKAVILHGDIQLLNQFAQLLDELEKDPAELLSPFMGDVVAQSATDLARTLFGKLQGQFQQDRQHLVENLLTERPVLVHRLQLVNFGDEVNELAQKTDALAQKIARLAEK